MLNIGKQLSTEQRLSKAVVDIMAKYVALAGVLMIGERSIKDGIPTACTNGRDEYYGRAFVDSLNDAELRFLILHESYHKLYRHLTTWRHLYEQDARTANMACDYVINCKIVDDNKDQWALMPECGLLDLKYRGWDSAAVFADLMQKAEDDDSQGDDSQGDGSQGDGSQGFDDHDWEGAQEMSEAEQRELARDVDEAVRQGAMVAGKLGTGVDRDLVELLQPQVDWREVLRDFITSTCAGNDYSTWKRPNRRFVAGGYYMPSGISERVDSVGFANDMSGSIGAREQSVILTEGKSAMDIVKPETVHVMYWDTKVTRHEKYTGDEVSKFAESTKPTGGGGTNVECVPAYMAEHGIKPQAMIVVTDGYLGGTWGEWVCPVLWVIVDNKHAKPPVGKHVHVSSRDL